MCGNTENPFFIVKMKEPPNPFSRIEANKLEREQSFDDKIKQLLHNDDAESCSTADQARMEERRATRDELHYQLNLARQHLQTMKEVANTR
jgi:hypothetical protein